MKKVRVAIVVNELLRGGAQRIVADIAASIDRSEFELEVIVLKPVLPDASRPARFA